jgi:4-amino-4-deoxy-L-arabinose transferase-like glycosyltransferase
MAWVLTASPFRPRRAGDASMLLIAVVLLALAVRLGIAVATPTHVLGGDPAVYDELGVSLAGGHGWSRRDPRPRPGHEWHATAVHPPAWPAVLGAAYALTAHGDRVDADSARAAPAAVRHAPRTLEAARDRQLAARAVTALLGALAVALIGLIGKELWGPRVGLIAAAVGAVYPAMAAFGIGLESEPLFVAVELGALYAVLRWRRAPGGAWWLVLAGVLGGMIVLTRSNGAVLLLALALAVWRTPRRSWRSLLAPAGILVIAALVVVPWTVRNVHALGATVPVATNLGKTLAGTYNPLSAQDYWRWRGPRRLPASYRSALREPTEAGRDRALTRAGEDYIRAHPASVPAASAWNTARLLELDQRGRSNLKAVLGSRVLSWASILGFWALAVVALAGAFTRRFRRAPAWFWLMPVLLWLGTAPFAVNFDRFRAPIDPFLVMAAALALAPLVERGAARRPRAAPRRPAAASERGSAA